MSKNENKSSLNHLPKIIIIELNYPKEQKIPLEENNQGSLVNQEEEFKSDHQQVSSVIKTLEEEEN